MRTQLAVPLLLSAVQGCVVPVSQYNQMVRDAAVVRTQNATLRESADRKVRQLTKTAEQTKLTLQARESSLSECETDRHNVQTRLDEATAIQQQLHAELQRLGKDATTLLADNGILQRALEEAGARLAELRRVQDVSRERVRASADLARLLKPQVEAKQLEVVTRDGEPVVVLLAKDLFPAGRADLRSSASAVLAAVAQTLSAAPGWTFHISGYTSSRTAPGRFRSPLDLSLARAQAVALKVISLGVGTKVLSVAGAGDVNSPGGYAAGDTRDRVELRVLGRAVGATGSTR